VNISARALSSTNLVDRFRSVLRDQPDPSKLDTEAIFAAIRAAVAEEPGLGIHHSAPVLAMTSHNQQKFLLRQQRKQGGWT
jgi:hypothetical protein